MAVYGWLASLRRFWSAYLDALERHLNRMDQSKLTKKEDGEKTTRLNSRK